MSTQNPNRRFFRSAREAVDVIKGMLASENFPLLASYVDLDRSSVPRDHVSSGEFFLSTDHGHPGIPGGFGKFARPFPLGFQYLSEHAEGDLVRVTTHIEIDQGDGMIAEARKDFYLVHSDEGYRLVLGTNEPL